MNSVRPMLDKIGKDSVEDFFKGIPSDIRVSGNLNLPEAMSEWELNDYFSELSSKNYSGKSLLGGGNYSHHIPSVVPYLMSRSEFLTSYTPYQPEMSQGTLQALFEFQTYIAEYLGMEFSNASMYDGATSFVEGILLSIRVTKKNKVLVSRAINPMYRDVLETYANAVGFEIIFLDYDKSGRTDLSKIPNLDDIASISIQSPNFFGVVEDLDRVKPLIGNNKTLFITLFSEILSYGLYRSPGEYGADIACGEAQSFGVSQSFGGPSLGVFAFNKKYLRNTPGRLVGETVDKKNRRSFCLTLATREQHIRREKASSNICSNQGLCALSCITYMSLLGGRGLKKLARINFNSSEYLKQQLESIGCDIKFTSPTFNEFVVKYPKGFIESTAINSGFIPGIKLDNLYRELEGFYLVTVTELLNKKSLDEFVSIVGGSK